MYCYRCGNKLPDQSLFCNRCGTRVRTAPERFRRSSQPLPPSPYEEEEEEQFLPRQSRARRVEEIYDDEEYGPEEDYYEEDEEEYYEEDLEEAEEIDRRKEQTIFSINPALYPVTAAYIIATFLSLLMAAVMSYFTARFWTVVLPISLICFIPAIIKHIKHLHTVFTLTTTKLEISQGLFSKSTQNLPLRNIQDVSVRETFKERLLGIGDIVIFTANDQANVVMNNINDPGHYADLILAQLRRWH